MKDIRNFPIIKLPEDNKAKKECWIWFSSDDCIYYCTSVASLSKQFGRRANKYYHEMQRALKFDVARLKDTDILVFSKHPKFCDLVDIINAQTK